MSVLKEEITIHVLTGDLKHAGTNADVAVKLHDKYGVSTEKITLNNFFKNDFEKGNLDVFAISREKTAHLGKIQELEIFRDDSGFRSEWFVERITVENRSSGDVHIFPVFRWLRPHFHYVFKEHDTCLPQDDDRVEQRKLDLEEKRKTYIVDQSDLSIPAKVNDLPADEQFSHEDQRDFAKMKWELERKTKLTLWTTGRWSDIDDVRNVYDDEIFIEPVASRFWQEDWFFGYQRINGPCPNLIRLCTEIPPKFAVAEEEVLPFFDGKTLEEAFATKRLFLCDLAILKGQKCKPGFQICAPMVLLFANNNDQLMPVAIQLFQEPAPDAPVFFPSDDQYTWLLAKMWYNHAEACYHQVVSHLGYTHFMMEGACLPLHRNVSISHPIFKLLAPHLVYLLAINTLGHQTLLNEGGIVDELLSIGLDGVLQLTRKGYNLWKMDEQGTLPNSLRSRGLYETDVLPGYHYRHDAMLVYNAIEEYVANYVNLYYDSPSRLVNDTEIQAWAAELSKGREEGGMGLQGVPGRGQFCETSELVQTLTSIIFTSSVEHAAVNFPQYDYYGFPPTYPSTLRGNPPSDKKPRTEADIIRCLDKELTLSAMAVTKLLSTRDGKPLGHFEMQYVTDPRAKEYVEEFRDDMRNIGKVITQRNSTLDLPYDYLHPDSIPNSIRI